MTTATPSFKQQEFDSALSIVMKWDFSLTKQKLLEPAYAGWTQERIDKAELDYKRYLALTKVTNTQPVPNGDIDRFWHEHILDTRRYAEDCYSFFGGFLHHYPFFGMRGEQDHMKWTETAEMSNELWKSYFGEYLYTLNTEAQKCPQACPGTPLVQEAQKCPQACPGTPLVQEAQKCPQACPGTPLVQEAQKCPQACPGVAALGLNTFSRFPNTSTIFDANYMFSPKFVEIAA